MTLPSTSRKLQKATSHKHRIIGNHNFLNLQQLIELLLIFPQIAHEARPPWFAHTKLSSSLDIRKNHRSHRPPSSELLCPVWGGHLRPVSRQRLPGVKSHMTSDNICSSFKDSVHKPKKAHKNIADWAFKTLPCLLLSDQPITTSSSCTWPHPCYGPPRSHDAHWNLKQYFKMSSSPPLAHLTRKMWHQNLNKCLGVFARYSWYTPAPFCINGVEMHAPPFHAEVWTQQDAVQPGAMPSKPPRARSWVGLVEYPISSFHPLPPICSTLPKRQESKPDSSRT